MIKRKSSGQTTATIMLGLFIIVVGLYFLFITANAESEIIEGYSGGPIEIFFIICLVYLILIGIIIFGFNIIFNSLNRYYHPEKYNYCKKCKAVIDKKPNRKLCNDCFHDIERAIKKKDLLKYKKDFLRQKKRKK